MTEIGLMSCCKKILITGATGLIGKEALQPLIEKGFEVYALTFISKGSDSKVHWINANLFNEEEVKKVFEEVKPEYLLNFAWATTGDYLSSDVNFDFLKAGMDLLKYFNLNGGKRAVFAGTCFEYEFKDTPLKEDDALNPTTVYAKCKNELREKAEVFCKNNDISFGWGRIFYVYGRGENEKRLTAHVVNSLKADKKVLITSGKLIKDYMYTKDIAGAFVNFLDTNVSGCVNICTGAPISIREYTTKIASKLSKEDLLEFVDGPTNQPPLIVGDNSKLINEVGYKIQYSLDEAIEEVINED